MARLDRTSGGSNTKKLTLTCLPPIPSPLHLPSAFNAGFAYSTLLIIFFLIKKKIGLKDQIYFTTPGWGQCHNLNELKFMLLFQEKMVSSNCCQRRLRD